VAVKGKKGLRRKGGTTHSHVQPHGDGSLSFAGGKKGPLKEVPRRGGRSGGGSVIVHGPCDLTSELDEEVGLERRTARSPPGNYSVSGEQELAAGGGIVLRGSCVGLSGNDEDRATT